MTVMQPARFPHPPHGRSAPSEITRTGEAGSPALPMTAPAVARTVVAFHPTRSTSMRHTTLAIAASAALIGGAALAVTAQGQDQTTKTITFTAGQPARRDIKQIDIKPSGESLGDQNIGAVTVRRDGKPIGRVLSQCTAIDARYEGQTCTITLLTRDGQIIAQGAGEHRALPGHGGNPGNTDDVFAITGGTGTYAGTTGTLRPHSTSKGAKFTVTLQPGT